MVVIFFLIFVFANSQYQSGIGITWTNIAGFGPGGQILPFARTYNPQPTWTNTAGLTAQVPQPNIPHQTNEKPVTQN